MATQPVHRRFTVDDYDHMVEAGILFENDRETKPPLYTSAGIPEAWLVDIPGHAIERHTNPVGDTHRVTMCVGRGEAIESTVFSDLRLKTDDILDYNQVARTNRK